MNTLAKIVRYHSQDRLQYGVLPCACVGFAFLVNIVIFAAIATSEPDARTYGLVTLCALLFVPATHTITRSLPFAFALGLSRRSYYLGTALFMLVIGAVYSLGVTVLQALERATGGWGMALHFFRIRWLLDGAWYQTWLTSFVLLVLVLVYGIWFGLVFRRWNATGLVVFIVSQVSVLLAATLLVTWTEVWSAIGEFFAQLSVLGLTGVLAAIAVTLAAGGFVTMRRVTV